jgi:predicted RND superfamily exporter protein
VTGRRLLLGAAARRPLIAVLAALLLTVVAIWLASTQRRTLDRGPIVVSFQGNLATTLDPANLNILIALEQRITALQGVQAVSGPGTFIEQSARQADRAISRDLAALHASGPAARRQQLNDLLVRYGYVGVPTIDNESFVGQLIFGSGTQPKQQFASLFPDDAHALVLVRPRAELNDALTQALANRIKRLVNATPLQGVQALIAR